MGKRILIVDDEPDIVKLLKARLLLLEYEVIAAYDGEEALDKVYRENPDLIILDITLPKIDGYKVCSILKNDPEYKAYKNVPIIMLTGNRKEVEDISTGLKLGADSYLQKPVKVELLVAIVQGLIGK